MALPDLSSVITPKSVKIQLGVDDTDIKDEKIKDSGLYEELLLDYNSWFPKFLALLNDASGTNDIMMQQIAVKSYGKYFLCYKLALSGRLSFFQKFGDGENADTRFNIDWDSLIEDWQTQMDIAKAQALGIATDMTPDKPSAQGTTLFGVVTPSVDVVRQ